MIRGPSFSKPGTVDNDIATVQVCQHDSDTYFVNSFCFRFPNSIRGTRYPDFRSMMLWIDDKFWCYSPWIPNAGRYRKPLNTRACIRWANKVIINKSALSQQYIYFEFKLVLFIDTSEKPRKDWRKLLKIKIIKSRLLFSFTYLLVVAP